MEEYSLNMMNKYFDFIFDEQLKKKYSENFDPEDLNKYDIVFISSHADQYLLEEIVKSFKKLRSLPIEKMGVTEDNEYYYLFCQKQGESAEATEDFEKYEFGFTVGSDIRDLHALAPTAVCGNWAKEYETKINQIFHEYGIQEYRGIQDYIFMDRLSQSKSLLKERQSKTLLLYGSPDEITIDQQGKFNLLKNACLTCADPYYLFRNINHTGLEKEEFCTGLIDGYFKGETPNLFFKYLALYTITDMLYGILEKENRLSKESLVKAFDELTLYYEDFSDIKPKWYTHCREKLLNY